MGLDISTAFNRINGKDLVVMADHRLRLDVFA